MAVELIQDAIVTAVACGAGAVVARRVFGFLAVKAGGPGSPGSHDGCDKCVSSPAARSRAVDDGTGRPYGRSTVHPLVVTRRPTSSRSISS